MRTGRARGAPVPKAGTILIDPPAAAMFHTGTKPIHRLFTAMAASGAALALAACSPGPEGSIVGKWARGNDLIFTFTPDGDMIRQEGAGTDTMGYSISGTNLYLKPKDLPT